MVWLDSDCFPVGPFAEEAEKIVSNRHHDKDIIAICQGKVGRNWQIDSPKSNIADFNMKPSHPYYNSGIWILRSKKVLDEWASEVENVPKNGMFEQDAFNYLLYKHKIIIHTLENNYWNVTHDSLNCVKLDSEGKVLLDNKEVLVLHLTGAFKNLTVSIGPLKGNIRAMINPYIRNLQIQLLKEWVVSINKLKNSS